MATDADVDYEKYGTEAGASPFADRLASPFADRLEGWKNMRARIRLLARLICRIDAE